MGNNKISRPETAVLVAAELFPYPVFLIGRNVEQQLDFPGKGHGGFFHFKKVLNIRCASVHIDKRIKIPCGLPSQAIEVPVQSP